MKTKKTIAVFAALLTLALMTTAAFAGIFATSGSVVQIAAPASVQTGALENSTQISVFNEQQGVTLAAPVAVDITSPGTFANAADLTPGSIPAGTVVSSHFGHFDPVGQPAPGIVLTGSMVFDYEIIGVAVLPAALDASDGALGAASTAYPNPRGVFDGLELDVENDSITIGCDTLTFDFLNAGFAIDQLRVITNDQTCRDIDIEKSTNGDDADSPTGPIVPVGDPVVWDYVVTNTGEVDLFNITVTDDVLGPICTFSGPLAVGDSFSCSATGVAMAGQYANLGTADGEDSLGRPVSDDDPSHYFGLEPTVDIEKATNGQDADAPTGPNIPVGDPVTWTYVVTNTGNEPLVNLTITDDILGLICTFSGPLAVGDSFTCTATGTAMAGQYANLGTVDGTGETSGDPVTDTDPSHYFGEEQQDGEGCTPGYWRQDQHFDSWAPTGYAPGDDFEVVFSVDASFDPHTLLDAVWLGGGDEYALARHAVAALLNAASPDVAYAYTVGEVIAMVQDAYATGDFEGIKDMFEAANETFCPID